MKRVLFVLFALNIMACRPTTEPDPESSEASGSASATEASSAELEIPTEPEPPVSLIQPVFPDLALALSECVSVADGHVCAVGTDSPSLIYLDHVGLQYPIDGGESRVFADNQLFALSSSSVILVSTDTDADSTSISTISRACAPWEALTPMAVINQPVVDDAQANAGLALLQGGTTDPQLTFIPSDCDSSISTLPLPGAQTVAAVAFDLSGSFVAVAGLRSRSLHVFSVQSEPPSLVAEASLELAIQPYVLASNGPASWVIMGANSEVATTLDYASGEPVFGELTFPAPLHRMVTTERSWVGWSASDESLYVGNWTDTTASQPLNGFPNLRSLAFAPDGRVIGVDESGGFVVSESTGLVRDSLETVSGWISGSPQTWAVSDQRLFELVP